MLDLTEKEIMKNWSVCNTDTPMVSVQCTTYNQEAFIATAIESFLMQKTNFPFEVIIHDDASTDNTANIVRKYAQRYPNIVKPILQSENQYSKKDGSIYQIIAAKTKGKYIALCEGDDYWCSDNKLQKQADFMESHPECSMCLHNTKFHYVDQSCPDRNFNNWKCIHKMTLNEIFWGWHVHTSSYFLRQELDYIPEFARSIWCGDFVYLTMAIYYGNIYVLPDIMSVYNGNILTGVTVLNEKTGYKYHIDQVKDRRYYLNKYNTYTKYKFGDLVQARIAEITISVSNDYKELRKAAREMSKNKYFKILYADKNFFERLKHQWKYRGYIFRRLWYFTILLQHNNAKKKYENTKNIL